ncbi:hypothetical protein [Polymorphobacter megasporae]|uniref:hypothetical protein n=1 Tax=Glacieibacterium megasporae TaxID=2835787 RepID=UPI001C1E2B7F|nr:hypothetical protein [Polymorphobacter megasporae]UAJ12557.1 hypothetical protein KTC28_18515 [Polymorphobacter megasporae]
MAEDGIRPVAVGAEPDAHGQAALLLAESILHALVDTSVLTNSEAINVVTNATEVKRALATAAGESSGRMQQSLDLLMRMTASFETDRAIPRSVAEPHFPRLA